MIVYNFNVMAMGGHRRRSIRRLGSPEIPISLPIMELYTFIHEPYE